MLKPVTISNTSLEFYCWLTDDGGGLRDKHLKGPLSRLKGLFPSGCKRCWQSPQLSAFFRHWLQLKTTALSTNGSLCTTLLTLSPQLRATLKGIPQRQTPRLTAKFQKVPKQTIRKKEKSQVTSHLEGSLIIKCVKLSFKCEGSYGLFPRTLWKVLTSYRYMKFMNVHTPGLYIISYPRSGLL